MSRAAKIESLTGLRFVAAAMIVIHHSRGVLAIPESFFPSVSLQHGVSFFFVLSGFILTYAYPALPNRTSIARFFIARFARVWPAHSFAFCVALAVGLHAPILSPLVGVANLSMVHAWVPATGWFFSFNAVSWSISTEFFFYLVFPFLIAGSRRTLWWKLAIAAALVFGGVALCGSSAVQPYATASPDAVNRAGILYISPFTRLFEFVLGMATAAIWLVSRAVENRSGTWRDSFAEFGAVVLCIGAVALFSAKSWMAQTFGVNWSIYLGHAGAAPAFALMILVFASQRGVLSRIFATRTAVLLGEISFSVYLLHQLMLRWVVEHRELWAGMSEAAVYLGFWIVLLAASWSVWRFVEKPARAAIMRLSPAR